MTAFLAELQAQWLPVWVKLPALLIGLRYTAIVAVTSFVASLLLGLVVAVLRRSSAGWLQAIAFLYIQLFRSLSLYVYILFIYFGLAAFLGLAITPLTAAIISVTLLNSAYVAEIYRSALDSVDPGQVEASTALGLSRRHAFLDVVLPQAMRTALPALANQLIIVVKDSSIVGVIGVADIMYEAQRAASVSYRQFEFLTAVAGIYIAIVFALSWLTGLVERRLKTP
ncbi:amino acid ABC transporter permease [Bosea sp. LjRoot237]|uniref:amino acid ABC transporter permease n=1 Tax=Bosea sp. LjRoot237 TaxID=3342292 RepID=UPI003ECE6C05